MGVSEVVLPRRAVPQPNPFIVSGGDCGACVYGGIFGISAKEAYERTVIARFGKIQSICWDNMRDAFAEAERKGTARAVTRTAHWTVDDRWCAWGAGLQAQWQAWSTYVRMALEAGYYGAASVSMDGRGPEAMGPDHWVLICGWRPSQDETILDEVLVSCSASHPEGCWMRIREFLQRHGGFNVLLARPA